MLGLFLTTSAGTWDILSLVRQITWSGSISQGARTLSFDVTSPPWGPAVTVPDMPPGAGVAFYQDERLLFSGFVVSRSRAAESGSVSVTCYDRGFYLLKNQGIYQFRAQTPDAITRRICADFGIQPGNLAAPGKSVTRNFLGTALYKIIMTAYTLAAQENGKAYQVRFRGKALDVVEIEKNDETLILEGGVNLQSLSASDSIDKTVTQAAIYDSGGKIIRTEKNPELIALYGVIQNAIRQSDGQDAGAKAKRLLADNGLSQTLTVEALGNIACITGGTVAVKEPVTGTFGLFWVTADKHVWKDGQYYCQLTLSYKRTMDEAEAGSLPNKSGSKTAASSQKVSLNLIPYNERLRTYQ